MASLAQTPTWPMPCGGLSITYPRLPWHQFDNSAWWTMAVFPIMTNPHTDMQHTRTRTGTNIIYVYLAFTCTHGFSSGSQPRFAGLDHYMHVEEFIFRAE